MSESAKTFDTLEATAKKWRVSIERLKAACERGDVPDAALLGEEWIIPIDTKRPRIKALPKVPQPVPTYIDKEGNVVVRTSVQDAVSRAIENGENLGGVSEYKIGNTTYIVSSIFKRQGPTVEELMFDRVIQGLQKEGLIAEFPNVEQRRVLAEIRNELRSKSSAFTANKKEKMEHYRNMLMRCGFTQEEVERLMKKIKADYEEPEFDLSAYYRKGK